MTARTLPLPAVAVGVPVPLEVRRLDQDHSHSAQRLEPNGDAASGSVERLGHPTRLSVERCRRQTDQRDRGARRIRRYDSVSLGVVLASMASAPRHRCERFATVSFTQDLPHPHRKLSKRWADRAFALHQWSMHQGKPEQRINRVKELGYLFVEEQPPVACDRLPH